MNLEWTDKSPSFLPFNASSMKPRPAAVSARDNVCFSNISGFSPTPLSHFSPMSPQQRTRTPVGKRARDDDACTATFAAVIPGLSPVCGFERVGRIRMKLASVAQKSDPIPMDRREIGFTSHFSQSQIVGFDGGGGGQIWKDGCPTERDGRMSDGWGRVSKREGHFYFLQFSFRALSLSLLSSE